MIFRKQNEDPVACLNQLMRKGADQWSSTRRALLPLLLILGISSIGSAQFQFDPNLQTSTRAPSNTNSVYRTIVTYNGNICLSTPSYDLMPNGQVIFKHQGMRFDGSGYFWSPAVRDNVVRRNHYEGRIIGTTTQYWPPLVENTQTPSTLPKRLDVKPIRNPYFGTGTQAAPSFRGIRPRNQAVNNQAGSIQAGSYQQHGASSPRLVRCPNGSYAIFCQ